MTASSEWFLWCVGALHKGLGLGTLCNKMNCLWVVPCQDVTSFGSRSCLMLTEGCIYMTASSERFVWCVGALRKGAMMT